VLTFEPHPRDYFAAVFRKPELAPARVATLRDKLVELRKCGVDQCVILKFDARLSSQQPEAFIDEVLVRGLGAKVRPGGRRLPLRRQAGRRLRHAGFRGQPPGFRRGAHEQLRGARLRVSSSAVREALARGDMAGPAALLGARTASAATSVHGRKLGRELGFKTLNLRFSHWKPAASGIFAVTVHGWATRPWRAWPTWASGPRWIRATSTAGGCCWRPIASTGRAAWARRGLR
jgi:riboflavin kinase/FMN adenylyltransferase